MGKKNKAIMKKNFRQLERVVKGFSNHRRIQILVLIEKESEISVHEISDELDINYKTASEHIRRMDIAGLIIKRSDGKNIRHKVTSRGLNILTFLRMLE